MKKSLLNLKFIALLLVVLTTGTMAMAQKVATASGNWSTPGTWTPVGVPTAGQTVTINDGVNVTVDVNNAVCASLTITGGSNPNTLTINTGNKLTVTGSVSIGAPTDGSSDKIISLGGGTLECGSLTMANTGTGVDDCIVNLNSGVLSVAGNITMNGTEFENVFNLGANGHLKLGGTISGGDFNMTAGNTFEYSGSAAQTIAGYSYTNLVLSGAGVKTLGGDRSITGNLTIEEGAVLTLGGSDLTLNVNANRAVTINGRLNINGNGRLGEGSGGTKTLVLGSTGYLAITDNGGTGIPSLNAYTFDPASTVDFGSTDAQTIENSITYGNIITSGSGTKTLETSGGSMTIAGSITIGSGTTLDANDKTVNVGGSFVNNGTFTQTNTTLVFNGSDIQTLGGSTALNFNNVTVNGAGVTLAAAATVGGTLTLTNGVVNATAANITASGAISGGSAASYVNGTLVKLNVPASAYVMPVGNVANGYRPITITPSNATSAFSARSFSGNPKVAFVGEITAPLTQVSNCEYWTVARTAGAANASVTMSWNNAICGGSNYVNDAATLLVARYDAGNTDWVSAGNSAFTVNTVTSASAGAFGTFALGTNNAELNPLPVTFNNVRAFEKNSGVQIEWSNMTEKDVIDYTVERSTNGQTYSVINTQNAKSNQDAREDYLTFDASPVTGVNYYRIKVRETTGKMVYSKVLKVEVGGRLGTFTVYPNPVVGGQMTVGLSGVKGKYNLQIVSSNGQILHTQVLNHAGGNMSQQVELPGRVKAGVYNVVISGDNYRQAKLFVVQ